MRRCFIILIFLEICITKISFLLEIHCHAVDSVTKRESSTSITTGIYHLFHQGNLCSEYFEIGSLIPQINTSENYKSPDMSEHVCSVHGPRVTQISPVYLSRLLGSFQIRRGASKVRREHYHKGKKLWKLAILQCLSTLEPSTSHDIYVAPPH